MSRYRRPRGLMICCLMVSLAGSVGCSRPAGLNNSETNAASDPHQVPFRDSGGKTSGDPNSTVPSVSQDKLAKGEPGLPFLDPQNLPAGTLLTVRLKNSVSADNPEATGTFEAVVDEPVTVEGNTLVPRGASVAGRIESARTSKVKGTGYVRVTLDSIDISGKDLRLQTSSLFARGNSAGQGPALVPITLEKGRRLTFRLTEPAYVVQPANSSR